MATRKEYPINLKSSKITIAMAQLAGPLPDGMHISVTEDGRETWRWKSLSDMDYRVKKVCGIIDELSKINPKPDIVVFPEYSFPVLRALPELQTRADRYGFTIVGGADVIKQKKKSALFNQCPIVVPQMENPIWVTKRVVSQWEEGLVDEAKDRPNPILVWTANGKRHWISVHICLDFSLAPEEAKVGGGIFIVPMTSPDVVPFLGWADHLLRLESGSATILCNSVGFASKGESSVVAVDPQGKPFKAPFELAPAREQVAIVEIDLQRLSPPKKTGLKHGYPLGKRFIFDLDFHEGKVRLQHLAGSEEEKVAKRGVINPYIFFDVLGKKLRMAFLNVPQFGEVEKGVDGKDFEVLAILGKEDVMVTHLAADNYDMVFDVTQAMSWIGIRGDTVTPGSLEAVHEDNFPRFRVDTYFKVLGVPLTEDDRKVFSSRERSFPEFEEIEKIFKLGQDWDDENVSQEERAKFLEQKWILNVTGIRPGDINAIMTIVIKHARDEKKAELLSRFEEKVVPLLLDDNQVTSLYKGSGAIGVDYLARLSLTLDSGFEHLYGLINRVHELSLEERLIVDTTTYIVVSTLAHLSLPKAVLVANLPKETKAYRDQRIVPYLNDDERIALLYQPEKEQLELIKQFQPIDSWLEKIRWLGKEGEEKRVFMRNVVRAIHQASFEMLMDNAHDPLQKAVERKLGAFIKAEISDDDFAAIKATATHVPSQKLRTKLNYPEKIEVVSRFLSQQPENEDQVELVKTLVGTNLLRNISFHDRNEEFDLEQSIAGLITYCKFIASWRYDS